MAESYIWTVYAIGVFVVCLCRNHHGVWAVSATGQVDAQSSVRVSQNGLLDLA